MNIRKKTGLILISIMVASTFNVTFAAKKDDIDSQIKAQQQILNELNDKKSRADSEEVKKRMEQIESQINKLRENAFYDTEGAIVSLSDQLNILKKEFEARDHLYEKMVKTLELLEAKIEQKAEAPKPVYQPVSPDEVPNSNKFLVNPGPSKAVSFTQDAINSQGNSTMVFAFSPNQLYKIYCRQGYLTDIELKKGENVKFVGGGDTAAWSVIANTVGGVPHVYIKPVVSDSTTNLIITTDRHSYQLIVNTSDWYNPIVKWTYADEDQQEQLVRQQKEERLVTGTVNTSPENLDFAYEYKQKNTELAPSSIFSDGVKTFIKFAKTMNKAPIIFVKGQGNHAQMVNYTIKDNCIIIEAVFREAELRLSDSEYITIKHKN